jgi:GntR family transcriptional regulator
MEEIKAPVARYQQVANRLRDAIERGEYQPGELLPSETKLIEMFGLSRTTIRQAIAALRAEGVVIAEHGKGVFVRPQRPLIHQSTAYLTRRAGAERAQWAAEAERQGITGTQRILGVETISAPREIAERLDLPEGAQVIIRRRLMVANDEPAQLANSYYPLDLVEGSDITRPEMLRGGTIGALERLGIEFRDFLDEVTVRMPTPEESQALQLSSGVPVIQLLRVAYSKENRPVEVSTAILAGDRHVLHYRIPGEE